MTELLKRKWLSKPLKHEKALSIEGAFFFYLLIKIFNKNNNWYGKIKQFSGKTYNISFDSNHIFYIKNKKDLFKEWMVCFISDYDNGKYN